MKKYDNYATTQAFTGDFETIKLGGHICKIKSVVVTPAPAGKQYDDLMTIEFDIAEGEQKGFFQKRFDELKEKNGANAKWPMGGKMYQTIKSADLKFFKGFMQNIEDSNSGYKWDWEESTLVGKLFGAIYGEEEYEGADGTVKVSTKCQKVTTIEKIKKGVPVPEIKRLAGYTQQAAAFADLGQNGDDELPF